MPGHTKSDLSEKEGSSLAGESTDAGYITDNLINSESVVKRRCKKCCMITYLLGYSVPLVLGFFMGYRYKADNCENSLSH